jgi:hypothetical protein
MISNKKDDFWWYDSGLAQSRGYLFNTASTKSVNQATLLRLPQAVDDKHIDQACAVG